MVKSTDFGVPEITDDIRSSIREGLRLPQDETLRISFLGGPGDVLGTYEFWKQDKHDPRVPIITYSSQFFELITQLNASAQIIAAAPNVGFDEAPFRFDGVMHAPFNNRREYFAASRAYADEVIRKVDAYDPHIVLGSTDFPSTHWKPLSDDRHFILSAHNTFWPRKNRAKGPKALIKHFLLRQRAKAIDDAVCTSFECRDQISEVTNGRVIGLAEVPQMIEHYQPQERNHARELIFVGRIEHNKGVFLLLEAMAKLLPKYPEIRLTIVGDGSAQEELQERIDGIGSPSICATGRLNGAEVHAALGKSDLLLCPTMTTFNEGLAVVGFEAAAHGVPSLLSSCVPAVDYLGESCAVFEADNLQSLESTLERLIADPEHYRKKVEQLSHVLPKIYDRDNSWSSQLLKAMTRIGQ